MDPNAHILSEEDHPFGMESFFQSKRVPLQGACPISSKLHVLVTNFRGLCPTPPPLAENENAQHLPKKRIFKVQE